MNLYDTHTMKRGAILVDVCGYTGEEDFYAMHKIIDEVIKPEDSGFSVDSMCIGGYFNKDGILVRTSSESPYDGLSFFYEPAKMSEKDVKKLLSKSSMPDSLDSHFETSCHILSKPACQIMHDGYAHFA